VQSSAARKPTPEDIFAWARDLYAESVDHKDAAGFAAAFTPDAWLRFGNADTLVGREAIREAIAHFFTAFAELRHQSRGAFLDGDTLVLEAVVTYTRHDERQVTIPAVTIFRLAGTNAAGRPVADQCRIYVDLAPLFAPTP
jgi:ketosteroid isomerase-like protein